MDRLSLKAEVRTVLGKKVKNLRKTGVVPGHVFGNQIKTEHVSVILKEFLPVLNQAGETGLIDLKIGDEQIKPVLIRDLQYDPVLGKLLNVSFYQVNLKEKVTVPVPIELIGDEPELVHLGEGVVLQNLSEVEVEALPTDLIEKIEVDISSLKAIDDVITVAMLNYDRDKINVLIDSEEVVVKLAPAITEEMKQLLEEQKAETEAAAEAATEEVETEEKLEEGEKGEEEGVGEDKGEEAKDIEESEKEG